MGHFSAEEEAALAEVAELVAMVASAQERGAHKASDTGRTARAAAAAHAFLRVRMSSSCCAERPVTRLSLRAL